MIGANQMGGSEVSLTDKIQPFLSAAVKNRKLSTQNGKQKIMLLFRNRRLVPTNHGEPQVLLSHFIFQLRYD